MALLLRGHEGAKMASTKNKVTKTKLGGAL